VGVIDLRSDTVSTPTAEMRRAMSAATLGDDVFGDDPTVKRLEEVAADRMGKQEAVFVPSGTMGNVVGVVVNARLGEELIADSQAHVFLYEGAGAASIAGVQIRQVATEMGVMSAAQIEGAIRPRGDPPAPHGGGQLREHAQPPRRGGLADCRPEGGCGCGSSARPAGAPRRRANFQRRCGTRR